MENSLKFKLPLDKRKDGMVILQDGTRGNQNEKDYFINIPIQRTIKKFDDYIQIDKDSFKTSIQRQNFNPFFIELSFFETIKSTGTSGLTIDLSTYKDTEKIVTKANIYDIKINVF